MENDIADVVKKTDQERLVIAELCVQRRNVFRFCRDSENDGTRITRRQGKDREHEKSHAQKHRNHVEKTFDNIFVHKSALLFKRRKALFILTAPALLCNYSAQVKS